MRPWVNSSLTSNNVESVIPNGGVLTACQNSRNLSTRFSDGLPAIRAELMAPIEMPATQSGCRLVSASAWYTPA